MIVLNKNEISNVNYSMFRDKIIGSYDPNELYKTMNYGAGKIDSLMCIKKHTPFSTPFLPFGLYGDAFEGSLWNPISSTYYAFRYDFVQLPIEVQNKYQTKTTIFVVPSDFDSRSIWHFYGFVFKIFLNNSKFDNLLILK